MKSSLDYIFLILVSCTPYLSSVGELDFHLLTEIISSLIKVLFGKWRWKFSVEQNNLHSRVVMRKFREMEGFGAVGWGGDP